jgi:mRNA interferase RelE/StbE
MRRRLDWDQQALDDLARISRGARREADRIKAAAERLAATGHGDVVKLAGQDNLYRLRVGDWRVIFSYENGGLVILALRVLRRNEGTYR